MIAGLLLFSFMMTPPLQASRIHNDKKGITVGEEEMPLNDGVLQWFDAGAGVGMRLSTLYSNGDGTGISPETFIRTRVLLRYNILLMAEAGYYQNVLPIDGGEIKADFASFAFLAGYNFSLSEKMGSIGSLIKDLSLYGFTGPVLNTHLTSQYHKKETGEVFSFDAGYNSAFVSWLSGVGVGLYLWRTVIFFEAAASVSLGKSLSGIASDALLMDSTGEVGVTIRLGTQLRIKPW